MGLVISNGIIALSGALMAQQEAMRMLTWIVSCIGLPCLIIGDGSSFSNVYLDRALAQYCNRFNRLPIFDLGRDCTWHQYQLYPNLQCLDLGYLPDEFQPLREKS